MAGGHACPRQILCDTVNEWAVRILLDCILVTTPNKVWGKVIFSQACVKNYVHRRGVPARGGVLVWGVPALGDACSRGVPASLGGGSGPGGSLGPHPRGKLRGDQVQVQGGN